MKEARKTYDTVTHENYKADSGAAVVMDNKTGQVIAMASEPTYDPNAWVGGISAKDYDALTSKKSNYPLLNRAIQGQSAPGSTFKVVSTSAAVGRRLPQGRRLPLHVLDADRRPDLQELRERELRRHLPGPRPGGLLRHGLLRHRVRPVEEGRRHQPRSTPRTGSTRPPTSSASAPRPASTCPARSPAGSRTGSGSSRTTTPTRPTGARPRRSTRTTRTRAWPSPSP